MNAFELRHIISHLQKHTVMTHEQVIKEIEDLKIAYKMNLLTTIEYTEILHQLYKKLK